MKRRPAVALLTAGALVLAACGDGDDAGSDTVPDTVLDTVLDTALDTALDTVAGSGSDSGADGVGTAASAGDGMTHADWPETLVVTLTPSQEAGGPSASAQALADALSEALGIPVEASVPSDDAGVVTALQSGEAQVAGGLDPAQMVLAADTAGADLALQAVRSGSSVHVAQWYTADPDEFCRDTPVVDEDGMRSCNGVADAAGPEDGPIGIDVLNKVAGKTVAFVDEGSTSGFQVPALALLDAEVDPFDDINQVMAGRHDAAVRAVYDGDAEVGVSFDDARTLLTETVPDVGAKVVVFGWSEPIPNDGFAIAGNLPDDLKTAIVDALLAYADTEEGAATLDALYGIEGFVSVPGGSYDIIRELQAKLGDRLG